METLNAPQKESPPASTTVVSETEEEEEEDSFFELEIADSDPHTIKCSTSNENARDRNVEYASAISVTITDTRCNNGMFQQRGASASQGDILFSKRKILPIEGLHRLQSPVSLLKSAPKFRVFTFAQSKSIVVADKEEAGEKQDTVTGSGNSRKAKDETDIKRTSDNIGGPKRFSREVIQKYLRLLKPLYVKASKKNGSRETVTGEFPVASSASPQKLAGSGKPPTGLLMKQLGKSRSATCRVCSRARMDDSLVEVQDGIQSAILHCKRSLSASRDFSPLSRCDEKMVDLRRFSMD